MRDARTADGGHPDDGVLRAYLDRELPPAERLRTAWHLRRCAGCRAALAAQDELGRRASTLLARAVPAVDVEEGWRRLAAVSADAGRPARWPVPWRAGRRAGRWLAVAALLLAVGMAAGVGLWRAAPRDVAGDATADVRDACCWDLDGGGRGDDGVFTRTRAGEVVECVVLYDDVDRSGTLTSPDVVRYVSSARACGIGTGVALPRRAGEVLPDARAGPVARDAA